MCPTMRVWDTSESAVELPPALCATLLWTISLGAGPGSLCFKCSQWCHNAVSLPGSLYYPVVHVWQSYAAQWANHTCATNGWNWQEFVKHTQVIKANEGKHLFSVCQVANVHNSWHGRLTVPDPREETRPAETLNACSNEGDCRA